MRAVPCIRLSEKSPAETVKGLIEYLNEVNYMPISSRRVMELERTLRSLTQYVTLIGFDKDGRLGYVDVDLTVKCLKNELGGLQV